MNNFNHEEAVMNITGTAEPIVDNLARDTVIDTINTS